jgi:Outer membrane protein beta-barrel domain
MKLSLKISLLFVGLATLVSMQSASAAPVRFTGSYVGGGVTGGVLESGTSTGTRTFGGNINARIALPNVPVSVRGNVQFANTNSAIVPTVTYDQGLSDKTNVYAGAGYSFVQNTGQNSPLGNRNSVVLNAGVESEVAKGLVVYGDAKYGLKAFTNGKGALAVGAGVGLKF